MTFGSTFGRVLSPTFQPKSQAAAGGWWDLNGTITSCIAAYQPKGAASYAASKVNLANAGTYDAVNGSAYPTWEAETGWSFVAANSQYLTTGIVPSNTNTANSAIVRFTNGGAVNYSFLFGARFTSGGYITGISPLDSFNRVAYFNCNFSGAGKTPQLTGGVLAFSGASAYRNGVDESITIPTGYTNNGYGYFIGSLNKNGTPAQFTTAKIQAIAFYNTAISAAQVAALTTAMAAL